MSKAKKAFLSYSHSDREFAQKIARELRTKGLDVWFDAWEIQAGDSIIHKVFTHGLSGSECFLILLSDQSVKSNWVRHELDTAMVQKLEGVTRVIPLIKEPCEIPQPLRALLWVDMSTDFDAGIERILHAVHDVSARPPLGTSPEYVTQLSKSIGGLSKYASTVGIYLCHGGDMERGTESAFSGQQLQSQVPMLDHQQLNDAVDELEEYGLVKTQKWMGTAPFRFGEVQPTYALLIHFSEQCDYDPMEDIKAVAAAAAAKGKMTGKELNEVCGLAPLRVNRAVSYLDDYGYLNLIRWMGTAPYNFGEVAPTRKTRQFVAEECK